MVDVIKKVAGCANIQQYQKIQRHFTSIAESVKAEFIRLAVWVSIASGA